MSAPTTLTAELRAEVLALEDDLRARVDDLAEVQADWRTAYDEARAAERTSAAWEAWRDERVTLAAVAWVITTVFVRFCEDNGLVKPVWITHAGGRAREATDAQAAFLRETARTAGDVTDREWLLDAVGHLKELPATQDLVDDTSPMWLVMPSGDAASRLLAYWRDRDDDGALRRDLTDPGLDTRFLGDLYQDVSEAARKRYALLQTPEFVEEFILDRTLEPALAERPLEGFKAIDPTCGSGHFLLGLFGRLLDRWHSHAPGMDERERVQAALDSVHGVDLNPYAVAISRFRLTVAALRASGLTSLEDAPAFRYHLAAGDSLLHGLDQGELDLGAHLSSDRVAAGHAYATENLADLQRLLRNGQYDCVVGNPPYITVSDPALNQAYRQRYRTCHRQYALTVPFMERFFSLARPGENAGWTGQITSNSFMKREFGVLLVQQFLPTRDLSCIVDTSGAYIPGHGTPTVIVVGRNKPPASAHIRAVLGLRGEPGQPQEASQGRVWRSIVELIDRPGSTSEWVSVVDRERTSLSSHPWSLTGGVARELLLRLDTAGRQWFGDHCSIGYTGQTNSDEAFIASRSALATNRIEPALIRQFVTGTAVRDFSIGESDYTIFPYSADGLLPISEYPEADRWLWPLRTTTWNRATFSRQTYREEGRTWWEWHQVSMPRIRHPLAITWAFVQTHNHFAFDRDARVFNRHAPIIKLPEGATEQEHMALLGVLNSSTACFWLKQNSHGKGNGGVNEGYRGDEWEEFFEFTGTTLKDFPLPSRLPEKRGSWLDQLAQYRAYVSPESFVSKVQPDRGGLDAACNDYHRHVGELISEQEELDWEVYGLYDLVDGDLAHPGTPPPLALGERAFEIALARRMAAGEEESAWFTRHGSTPITEIPSHWPADYQALVQRRLDLIASHPHIRLLEKPEHKRRWATESWEKQEERALRGWLLDRLEERRFWFDSQDRPSPTSVAQLADAVSRDADLVGVLALWEGRPDVAVVDSLSRLLSTEAVPYLAAQRYKEPGLRKRATWEHTWALQRQEDAGVDIGTIPVPTKYTSADFTRQEYWSHRGKLDVPKERFILYPGAGRDTDPTPVLGWAGWDHAEQSLAIAGLIQDREDDGWADERLLPLVAGLAELLPWVTQWHGERLDSYGGASPAEFFAEQLDLRMTQVGATEESLRAWRPAPTRRGKKKA